MMLIGVDPHKATHTATAVEPDTNREVTSIRIDATLPQYRRLLTWATRWPHRRWAIENAEGLGRHLASWLLARGEHVVDVPSTATARVRQLSRGGGRKNDRIDAAAAACVAALQGDARPLTAEGATDALAVLDERRINLAQTRVRAVNQLHALLRALLAGGAPQGHRPVTVVHRRPRGRRPGDQQPTPQDPRMEDPSRGLRRATTLDPTTPVLQRLIELAQYLSGTYLQQLAGLGMRASVGRTGVCWDKSVAEAFWSSLKRELIHRRPFATRADARRVVFVWINWYNRTRLHSTLNYRSPLQWEQRYVTSTPTAAHKPHHPVSGQRGEPHPSGSLQRTITPHQHPTHTLPTLLTSGRGPDGL